MTKISFITFLIFISFLSSIISANFNYLVAGELTQKSVITNGLGKDEKNAILDGLVQAVAQIRGLAIKSSEILSARDQMSSVTNSTKSSEDIQTNIKTYTNGIVSSFDVLEKKETNGIFKVRVKAVIPFYEVGNQINRLRLALAPFRMAQKITNKAAAQEFSLAWNNNLEEDLVQSRRFAMVDRTYSNETNQELAQYTDQSFNISELARLGQKIGTDYLVVGEVKKYNVTDKSVSNPLDDTKISRSSINTEISLRVIDVATSQIKFAKSYTSSKNAVSDIINAIYPIFILSVQDNFVTIGSGGNSLKLGERFRVMGLGDELKDPYTGESLGKQESYIGEIEITDVQFKTSQAKVLKGQDKIAQRLSGGLIIRPLVNNQQPSNPKTSKKTEASSDKDW